MSAKRLQLVRRTLEEQERVLAQLSRNDINVFAEYVLRDERGAPVVQEQHHQQFQQIADENPFSVILAFSESAKCEATGSMVALADGTWSPIERLTERTKLLALAPEAQEFRVVEAGPVSSNGQRVCVRVTLADGRVLTVTEEHPLYVRHRGWTPALALAPGLELLVAGTTAQPRPETLSEEDARTLGYLTDLTSVNDVSATIRTRARTLGFRNALGERGWTIQRKSSLRLLVTEGRGMNRPAFTPAAFLRRFSVEPGHVPPALWTAGELAVSAYLRAVLDQGFQNVPGPKRRASPSVGEEFANELRRLALSVGMRLHVHPARASELFSVQFKWCQVRGKVTAGGHGGWNAARSAWCKVTKVEKTEPLETWALPVHDDCHCYLSEGVVSHNTTQLAVVRTVWELGNDPNLAFLIISNTAGMSEKIVGAIKDMIVSNRRVQRVFPHLRPGTKWANNAINVARPTERKDYSVQGVGVGGNVLGSRIDRLVFDDILDFENTLTKASREQVINWVKSTPMSRLTPSARVIAVGNAWHREDAMHWMSEIDGWAFHKLPLLDPSTGECAWPDRFPPERIEEIRARTGPREFGRMYLCEPRDDAESRFRSEWLIKACQRGAGKRMQHQLYEVPQGAKVLTGVDLGVRTRDKSDPTVFATVLAYDNGDYELLNIEGGRWDTFEIVKRAGDHQNRYASTLIVEDNAAQYYLVDILRQSGLTLPIKNFTTTAKAKRDPIYGVEALANELALGRWVIPSIDGTIAGTEPEVRKLLNNMLDYLPQSHTGDYLMAVWLARQAKKVKGNKASVGKHNLFVR